MVRFSRAIEVELHALAKAAGVRLHRAEEKARAADKDSPPILVNHDPSAAVVGLYAGAPGDTSRPLMQFEAEAIPAFDPADLRKVLESLGCKRAGIDAAVAAAVRRCTLRGQTIKEQLATQAQTAAEYERKFGELSLQLEGLMSPPPARRPGVKPAISGLTRTVAEDHRLGRFKG